MLPKQRFIRLYAERPEHGTSARHVTIYCQPKARWVTFLVAALLLPVCAFLFGWGLLLGPSEKQNIVWMFAGFCGLLGIMAAAVYAMSGATIIDGSRRVVRIGRNRTHRFDDIRSIVLIDGGLLLHPSSRYQLRIAAGGEDEAGLELVREFREAVAKADALDGNEQLEARLALFMPLFEQPSAMLTMSGDGDLTGALAEELAELVSVPLMRFVYETTDASVGAIDLLTHQRFLRLDSAAETKPPGYAHGQVGATLMGITLLLLLMALPFVAYHKAEEEERMARVLATALVEVSKEEDRWIRNRVLLRARSAARLALVTRELWDERDPANAESAESRLFQTFVAKKLVTARFADALLRNPARQELFDVVAHGHREAKEQRRISDTKYLVVRSDEVVFTMTVEGPYWLIDSIDTSRFRNAP